MRLFAPIVMRVDTLLSRLPKTRSVLFRGVVEMSVASGEYDPGRLVAWHQPTSVSHVWAIARRFGGTIFAIDGFSTTIDYLSVEPTEHEAMLPSFTVLVATGAMSPTLLRLLDVRCNVVTLRELGDEPSRESIGALEVGQRRLAEQLFAPRFTAQYVEGTLCRQRPPVGIWEENEKLFTMVNRFVEADAPPPQLILGDAGAGKTSAMLAADYHLTQRPAKEGAVTVVPIFLALPQLADVHDSDALDRRVLEQLGVASRSQAEFIARHAIVVLLLDSLDECNILPERRGRALIDEASFCATHCRIVASCRTESAHFASRGIVFGRETSTWYVQPFDVAEWRAYVEKFAATSYSGGCTLRALLDAVEQNDPAGELRVHPVTLSLMLRLPAVDNAPLALEAPLTCTSSGSSTHGDRNATAASITAHQVLAAPGARHVIESPRAAVYRRFVTAMCVAAAARHADDAGAASTSTRSLLIMTALEDVALAMLAKGHWQIPLGEVLFAVDEGSSCLSAAIQSGEVACRVDSMETSAQFSFAHKTIAEYLAASGLWNRPQVLSRIPITFSREELGVVRWFGDMSSGDPSLRATVCGEVLLAHLQSDNEAVSSNAMALVACSGYPLDGRAVVNRFIRRCNLRHANLSGCDLSGTTFDRCELHNADFTFATVEGTVFLGCEFGQMRCLRGHTDAVTSVCATLDNRHVVSGSKDKTVRMWDVVTGREVRRIIGHTDAVTTVSVSPGGYHVISGSDDRSVRMWDVTTGHEVRNLTHTASVTTVCVTPDGRHVVSATLDKCVWMWDIGAAVLVHKLEGHTGMVSAVSVTPDGRHVVSASWDKSLRFWDVVTGREVRRLEGHTTSVLAVSVTPDGRHVVSGSVDSVRVWDVSTGREVRRQTANTYAGMAVTVTPDGRHVVLGSHDSMRLWDVVTGRHMRRLDGHTHVVHAVSVTPDGRHIISGSLDKCVQLWDVGTGRDVRREEGHASAVMAVTVTPDGSRVVSGSWDESVRLWDVGTGREVRRLAEHTGAVFAVSLTPDGRHVVTGSSSKCVCLRDIETGREVRKLEGHTDAVRSVTVTPDGCHVVSGSDDKSVRMWDIGTGGELLKLEGHTDAVLSVGVTPDGRFIVSGPRDHRVRIWDVATGQEARALDGHTDWVTAISVSPDSCHIVSGSRDNSVRIWDFSTGCEVRKLEGHMHWVTAVLVTPDGRHIVSGSSDKCMRIWDFTTGKEVRTLVGHTSYVSSICVTADGRHAVSGSADRSVRWWKMPGAHPATSCRRCDGNMVACGDPDGLFTALGSVHLPSRRLGVGGDLQTTPTRGTVDGVRSDEWAWTLFRAGQEGGF